MINAQNNQASSALKDQQSIASGQRQVDSAAASYQTLLAADAVKKQLSLGIVANGTDGVFGSYDTARVQTLINDYGPVFAAKGKAPKEGLKPSDIFTNEFLDKTKKF